MVALKRQATLKAVEGSDTVLQIEYGQIIAQMTLSQAQALGSASNIQIAVRAAMPEGASLVFIHENRDGTLAMAMGVEPEIWPEDNDE